jgi:uncharacterized OB-fold protein
MDTPRIDKPRPVADHLTAPYWDGCRQHELRLQRCTACGTHRFPPGPVCTSCRSPDARWVASSGRGTVYSWIVVRHPIPAEIYAQDVPYVVALVELDEGVRVPTNIVDCPVDEVVAGMAVEVVFRDAGDDLWLPVFRPIAARSPAAART